MYQKILVPLDGSPFSEEILPLAIGAARRTGAELRLVHVMEPFLGRMIIESATGVEQQLNTLASRVASTGQVTARAELLVGKAIPELGGYITKEAIDLVILATHGWGGLQRAWLGSVTDALVRMAAIPLLTSRPRTGTPRPTPPPATPPGTGEDAGAAVTAAAQTPAGKALLEGSIATRPLLTLDGSTLAETAIEPLLDLVGPDADYTLLRVVQLPIPPDAATATWAPELWQDQIPALQRDALEYLDQVAARIAPRVRNVQTVVLTELSPAPAILDFAARQQIDLIALSTRGHGGLRRLALGSVADKVLRGAEVPVLVVPPGGR
jgi:nucleotide-binding universal stress UspA family protein